MRVQLLCVKGNVESLLLEPFLGSPKSLCCKGRRTQTGNEPQSSIQAWRWPFVRPLHLNPSSAVSCAQSKSGPYCNLLGRHSLKGKKQGQKHSAEKWPLGKRQYHNVPWDLGSCKLTFGATCGKGSLNTLCAYSTNCNQRQMEALPLALLINTDVWYFLYI